MRRHEVLLPEPPELLRDTTRLKRCVSGYVVVNTPDRFKDTDEQDYYRVAGDDLAAANWRDLRALSEHDAENVVGRVVGAHRLRDPAAGRSSFGVTIEIKGTPSGDVFRKVATQPDVLEGLSLSHQVLGPRVVQASAGADAGAGATAIEQGQALRLLEVSICRRGARSGTTALQRGPFSPDQPLPLPTGRPLWTVNASTADGGGIFVVHLPPEMPEPPAAVAAEAPPPEPAAPPPGPTVVAESAPAPVPPPPPPAAATDTRDKGDAPPPATEEGAGAAATSTMSGMPAPPTSVAAQERKEEPPATTGAGAGAGVPAAAAPAAATTTQAAPTTTAVAALVEKMAAVADGEAPVAQLGGSERALAQAMLQAVMRPVMMKFEEMSARMENLGAEVQRVQAQRAAAASPPAAVESAPPPVVVSASAAAAPPAPAPVAAAPPAALSKQQAAIIQASEAMAQETATGAVDAIIQATGASIPEQARDWMVASFAADPARLRYISQVRSAMEAVNTRRLAEKAVLQEVTGGLGDAMSTLLAGGGGGGGGGQTRPAAPTRTAPAMPPPQPQEPAAAAGAGAGASIVQASAATPLGAGVTASGARPQQQWAVPAGPGGSFTEDQQRSLADEWIRLANTAAASPFRPTMTFRADEPVAPTAAQFQQMQLMGMGMGVGGMGGMGMGY